MYDSFEVVFRNEGSPSIWFKGDRGFLNLEVSDAGKRSTFLGLLEAEENASVACLGDLSDRIGVTRLFL